MDNRRLNKVSAISALVFNTVLLIGALYFFSDIAASAEDHHETGIVLYEDNTGSITNSSKRITFNWTQTSGDPIVFESDKILFSNGTILLS